MLLAIDAGNTNTVFAVFDGLRLRGEWRIATDERRTADEYAVWLTQLLALNGLAREYLTHAIIASVVPGGLFALRKLCRQYLNTESKVVGEPGLELGVEVKVERPGEVGADRLVNAVAAYKRHGGPAIVIDFGTATTFDVVDGGGAYAGGVICPGINLSLEALHRAAAKLPKVAIQRPERVIGQTTVSAMQSGVYWGYVSMIEGLVERIRAERGEEMKTIATGGLAPLFAQATAAIEIHDPDLTIFGLLEIFERNR